MAWTSAQDLRQQVRKLWDRGMLLAATLDETPRFPLRLVLKGPSSRELSERFDEARRWIQDVRQLPGVRIEMKRVQHPVLGQNEVPAQAWLDSLEDAVQLLGKRQDAARFAELVGHTRRFQPKLLPWIEAHPLNALDLAEAWPKLLEIVAWLQAHPRPGIYLRQVDIPGIDTKFIERHRGTLSALLDLALPATSIDTQARGPGQFEARYGFLRKPQWLRLRVLDPEIRLIGAADSAGIGQDISLTRDCFRTLDGDSRFQGIRKVFITENEINFLTFPQVRQGLALFGQGYGFEVLEDVPWLSQMPVYYWGDIDTHGFAILDQLRSRLPHARSLLMNEATLLAHRHFWGRENSPEHRDLERLTPDERRLYDDLRRNRFGEGIRLEQERVGFQYVLAELRRGGHL